MQFLVYNYIKNKNYEYFQTKTLFIFRFDSSLLEIEIHIQHKQIISIDDNSVVETT